MKGEHAQMTNRNAPRARLIVTEMVSLSAKAQESLWWRNWNTPKRVERRFTVELTGYGLSADAYHKRLRPRMAKVLRGHAVGGLEHARLYLSGRLYQRACLRRLISATSARHARQTGVGDYAYKVRSALPNR